MELDHPWRRADWCHAPLSTYRFAFEWGDTGKPQDWGLLIHRGGNRLAVWLNGTRVAEFGALEDPDADYSNLPLLAHLPWHLRQPGNNTVLIQVAGDCRRLSGLSTMELGPWAPIAAAHTRATELRTYPAVVVISLCTLMMLAAMLYATLTQHRLAWSFALANGLWAASTALWWMREPPLPYALWYFFVDASFASWVMLVARQCMWLSHTYQPWVGRLQWVTLFQYLLLIAVAAVYPAVLPLKPLSMYVALAVYVFLVLRVIVLSAREPSESRVLICLAIVPMLGLGALDHWASWLAPGRNAYQSYFYSPLVSLALLLSLGLLMMRQFQQAMRNDQHYRQSLESEVERQRQELALHYQHEREHAKQAAVQAERQRIVRDMHDGLGAQLVGMLASVRSDTVNANHLEDDIALAMEHLRATMDNLSSVEQDLSTVLAQFRFHHAPRLVRAGLQLRWRVDALPNAVWPPAAVWEMQQMLREVFANILKHAKAAHITVTAGCQEGVCSIGVSDDGKGFDPGTLQEGRGLQHLRDRARHVGVQLDVFSAPGKGTTITWRWGQRFSPKTTLQHH